MSIETELIRSLSPDLVHFVEKKTAFQFQCPYCQVGRKSSSGKNFSPSRASGYLYQKGNSWNFVCKRKKHCGKHVSFANFLEENFPDEFLSYVRRRDELGIVGYQTNCPSLETVLKRRGSLPNHPPKFHEPNRTPNHTPKPSQSTPEAPVRLSEESGVKITKLEPMRSASQQAGHQSKLNRQVKEYRQRRNRESGDFYL
jgi:hypothetical protein